MKRVLVAAIVFLPAVLLGAEASVSPAEKAASQVVTPELLRSHVRFLASDLLEGRGTATRGDQLAEAYCQAQMEAMGLKPGAPGGSWYQEVPLVGLTARFSGPALFRSERGTAEGQPGGNFVAVAGVQKPEVRIENAEIVFVGYGIVAPEYQWDDFKDVDVKGKVLLVMNNDPENDPNLFAGKTRLWYGRWDYKYMMAGKKGAAGAIIIHTTHSAGYPWQVVQTSWAGENFQLPEDGSPRSQINMWATEELSKKLAELGGKDLDALRASAESRSFHPVPLGVTLSFGFANTISRKQSENVIGMLPGADPKLAGEAVFYTAHHDHFGIKAGAKGADASAASGQKVDDIYNGAVDNASGVASILGVAAAFTHLPKAPRRSVYFAFVTAEEQGLLGSEYLAKNPPLPAGRIAADINIDSANWFGKTRDVSLVGLGKSSVDAEVETLAKWQGRRVEPDQFPDQGIFYRSDQFSLAKVGVPAAYIKFGTDVIGKPKDWGTEQVEFYRKNIYHQPSDELNDTWDFAGAVEDAQLAFLVGNRIANADAMPRWNKGDEFEAVRLKALADTKPH
jgi:Zn-dependent M28 family amino/carboxypeptidase